ncbi:MAG: hypothetical protein WCK05_08445 [Planctomycetota bacterium]
MNYSDLEPKQVHMAAAARRRFLYVAAASGAAVFFLLTLGLRHTPATEPDAATAPAIASDKDRAEKPQETKFTGRLA